MTAALLKAVPVEGGVARLLQPVEEAHRDAGTRRGAGMSVAHGCREKRITGRAEEKDGHYGDLHQTLHARTPPARARVPLATKPVKKAFKAQLRSVRASSYEILYNNNNNNNVQQTNGSRRGFPLEATGRRPRAASILASYSHPTLPSSAARSWSWDPTSGGARRGRGAPGTS